MVQLSLLDSEPLTLESLLSQLTVQWESKLGAGAQVRAAGAVVRAHFAGWAGRALAAGQVRRVSAYFAGVVRRRLIRPGDPGLAAARQVLVIASIEADLREAGWSRERAEAEARRVCGLEPFCGVA